MGIGIGTLVILGAGYIVLATLAASALCRALFKKEDHYIKRPKIISFRPDPDKEFMEIHHNI